MKNSDLLIMWKHWSIKYYHKLQLYIEMYFK